MTADRVRALAQAHSGQIIAWRRRFHRIPESSMQEYRTTEAICTALLDMGIAPRTVDGLTGCSAELIGNRPGPVLLLRADIDALPVQEATGLPFVSQHAGMMHACGHDCHIAMLLGAARILSELRDCLPGTVRLLFQPGEESAQGAAAWIEQGILQDVSACFGLHIWSALDAPTFSFAGGARMASCDTFALTVTGRTAHGSAPQQGKDALVAASAIVLALQTVVSRRNDPCNGMVLTLGTIDGGTACHILPDRVCITGAVRSFSKEMRLQAEALIGQIARQTASAHGCSVQLHYNHLIGPVCNDSRDMVALARRAATALYGDTALGELPPIAVSEDFSLYLERLPGVFGFIGGRSSLVPGSEQSNHHECFTVDENALHHGAALYAQYALDCLGSMSG